MGPRHLELPRGCGLLLRRRVWIMVFAVWVVAAAVSAPTAAAEAASAKRQFNVPAGAAADALRKFSTQSGHEVVFAADTPAGVKTNAVVGQYTPGEAVKLLLAATGLTAKQDPASGAFMVNRASVPNAPEASPPTPRPPEKKTPEPDTMKSSALRSLLSLFAFGAADASAQSAPTTPAPAETVQLSPFTVTSDRDAGYYGANTMSGTRMNTKIEDLGSSITVITKEQMLDLALLNMDDIFSYEASTEGTRNYTAFSFDRNQVAIDNTQFDPLNANRIRGVGAANVSFGNFETSGRTPIDVLDIDAVEIGRGPNSNVFGIGNASGTVNTVRANANVFRNRSQVGLRVDSYDGYRTSLDVNRVLLPGKLAIRGTAVAQRDSFQLKPSGTLTERYNGMVRYQPFKTTSLSASYTYYHSYGNRPNTTTPREAITAWRDSGSPTWDPLTNSATRNGITTVGVPSYFNRSTFSGNTMFMLDRSGMFWFGQNSGLGYNMQGVNQDPTGYRASQPLVYDYPALTSKSIYDWTRFNLGAPNRTDDKNQIASVLLDQTLFTTQRQAAFVQLGWFREQTDRYTRNVMGNLTQSILSVDVNKNLPDGRANPGFLRPYVSVNHNLNVNPLDRDTYRAQGAYKLDFTQDKNWKRWLGRHDVGAFYEYKDFKTWSRNYEDVIIDDHTWLHDAVRSGGASSGLPQGNTQGRPYPFFYLGDAQGQNVDYGAPDYKVGTYPVTTTLTTPGQWVTENALIGPAWNGGSISWTELKSRGVTLQSRLFDDRVVTTFGLRRDARYSRVGTTPLLNKDGYTVNEASFLSWAPGDWVTAAGPTRTAGIVVKPLKWLSVYANKSNSFQVANPQTDVYLKFLPNPTGKGEDYGVMLNLFAGKVVVRANQYTTTQAKSRNGNVGIFASRLITIDRPSGVGAFLTTGLQNFVLVQVASGWVTRAAAAKGQTLTQSEITTQVAAIMKMPVSFLDPFQYAQSGTSDQIAKGREIEISYNPTKFWTMKVNVTQSETIQANIGREMVQYLNDRMKVWTTIIDPELGVPWFTHDYSPNGGGGPSNIASVNVEQSVRAPMALQLASEGLSNPQIRKYRVNAMSNYRLEGITDNKILKRFNVGGALRWEDKGAIGYWGKQQVPVAISEYDPFKPIYDRAHLYVDAFAGYRTRMFGNKVGTTFQLNARDLTEGGRLQPIAADPDGSIAAWRIVSRRQFILTATFDF